MLFSPRYLRLENKQNKSNLKRLFTSRLNRQKTHRNKRGQHQRSSCIDRSIDIIPTIDGNNRCTQPSNPIQTAGDTSARTSARGGEDLRRVGVQNTVHDHLEEGLEGGADELGFRGFGDGEAEEKNTCDQGGDGHCALSADVFDVDGVTGDNGARETNNSCDAVVAVGFVGGGVVAEVLGEECVEESVTHSNGGPEEPDDNSCMDVSLRFFDCYHKKKR